MKRSSENTEMEEIPEDSVCECKVREASRRHFKRTLGKRLKLKPLRHPIYGKITERWQYEDMFLGSNAPKVHRHFTWRTTEIAVNTFVDSTFIKMYCASLNGETTSVPLIHSYRIKHVELIGMGDGTGVSFVSIIWGDEDGPDNTEYLSFGPTMPVRAISKPEYLSTPAKWQSDEGVNGTKVMFKIDTTELLGELVMRVHFELVFAHDGNLVTAGPTAGSSTESGFMPKIPVATQDFVAIGVQTA
jgi:hypothetical protein